MEWQRSFQTILLCAGLATGCGTGGSSGSGMGPGVQQARLQPNPTQPSSPNPGPTTKSPGGVSTQSLVTNAIQLPSGYEQPRGIAFANGTLYFTARSSSTQKAVVVSMKGSQNPQIIAQGDTFGVANAMTDPVALAVMGSTVYVADFSSNFSPDASGAVLQVLSNGSLSVVSAGSIDAPTGIAVSQNGTLLVAGSDATTGQGALFELSPSGGSPTIVTEGGPLTQPTGLAVTSQGDVIMTDAGERMETAQIVSVQLPSGTAAAMGVQATCAVESGIIVESNGNAVFAAQAGGEALLASASTQSLAVSSLASGSPLVTPQGLAWDGASIYVADQDAGGNGEIFVLQ